MQAASIKVGYFQQAGQILAPLAILMMILQGIFQYITARYQIINDAARHFEHVHELFAGPSHSSKIISEKSNPAVVAPRSPPKRQLVWLITGIDACKLFTEDIILIDRQQGPLQGLAVGWCGQHFFEGTGS